jgi:spore maturation protein SpmA
MVLNYIWIFFFLVAFAIALVKLIVFGDTEVINKLVTATFDSAKTGFEISIGMTGVMTLWLGLMRIGERAGAIQVLTRLVSPFFSRLFPEIPKGHPVMGSILMNFSANALGLDNAATPLGLRAMQGLQELNPNKETASNAQIMFLVLNTAGLTLIPVSILSYRAQLGAANPADVFVPILLATFFGLMTGMISVAIFQRINLFNRVILAYLIGLGLIVGGIVYYFSQLPQEQIGIISTTAGGIIILSIMVSFIVLAIIRKVNAYEEFIEGAKEGFEVAIKIIPYLVAILVAIGMFRASGALDYVVQSLGYIIGSLGINTDFVPALPVALMVPLSGSGARGMMLDVIKNYGGPDSFVGHVASTLGSTETTFYILAVYFGSVGIKNTRYAVICGLLADLGCIVSSIIINYLFFHK